MTTVYYYEHPPPPWPEYVLVKRIRSSKPVQPGFVHETLENICTNVIADNLPKAWFWDEDEVCDWLGRIGLGKYSVAFKKNKIRGHTLPLLNICMLQQMKITVFQDAMAILTDICLLFGIKFDKKFNGPIEEPKVDPKRRYLWYRREHEIAESKPNEPPLSITEWLFEKGFLHKHYRRWETLKYFNQLPFKIGYVCPKLGFRLLESCSSDQ